MLKLLTYLLSQPRATGLNLCPPLDKTTRGLPALSAEACSGTECNACAQICPTNAITVTDEKTSTGSAKVALDLGSCIGCGLCFENCPSGTIVENLSSRNARRKREELVLSNDPALQPGNSGAQPPAAGAPPNPFNRSLHARVVSTSCAACDLELGASQNAIFDMERFGVHVVASPRYADALIVTGPVGKGMQVALKRCYEAMPEPRAVVAAGTCAISGGVHRGGYTEANGTENVLPVDVYIPGCPPHPWQLIYGVLLAMGRAHELKPETPALRSHAAKDKAAD
jgi:Ni,Fe-hydrogenase III small subunit/formate hydrogenlyase subunit 6/NADH:ubiquinone oxidoreductase subunit I